MRRLAAFFAATIFALAALPASVSAIEYEGVSAYPANPVPGDDRTASWFVYTLSPGGSREDAVVISNQTAEERTIDLYPADSTPTTGDGFALKQQAETMTEVGSWIKLDGNSVTLKPHGTAEVKFSLAVPEDKPAGLYAGGIMLAEREKMKTETAGLDINVRMGVRVYVTVANGAAAPENFSGKYRNALAASAASLAFIAAMGIVLRRLTKKTVPTK
jgi:hypothetical protein